MLFILFKLLHLLAVMVWVGGMFFAHFFLRPAVQGLQPPERVKLMHSVLQRFFAVVMVLVVVILASGVGMIGSIHAMAGAAGGKFNMPATWIVMSILGLVMMAVFGHIRFALFKRLDRAVEAKDWPAGGKALERIRKWVALNLALGLVIIIVLRVPL
ncbi:CopD family protein [Comamonas resistens]|uniref:CopD family protein n=1 Tax=Comamonas resistens TaxID=3046670 RepID=A0ABY8SM85_9BURK|nr:CopD family protein [Comamonas resistens]MDL5034839.1 CopD family protein [Comamonas resistens]WHS63470.1 CopD family protein [Comamonas resistens]